MSRILVIATTEFLALVRTKGFVIGLVMGPVLITLAIGFQRFAAGQGDVDDHRFAVIDRTGALFTAVAAAAAEHNAEAGLDKFRTGPHFLPELIDPTTADAVELSARVRRQSIEAFVDIPATVIDPARAAADRISFYTNAPSYTPLPDWLRETLNREIAQRRFDASTLDPAVVAKLTRPTPLTTLSLFERRADGTVVAGKRTSQLETFVMAFGMMYLLFMALMTSAPHLLTAVVEEKMSRISEVLLSAVSPIQLMAGKLLGVSAVAVLLALLYLVGGTYVAINSGQGDLIRPALFGWFLVYLICTVLIFGALFVAIGAMCSDLKDSQAIMPPVMILVVMPVFMSPIVLRAPNSLISVVLSLVPIFSPFLMLMRLSMAPGPPLWQVAVSVVTTMATAAFMVWVAARIFRIGLLMQGKPPNLPELLRWIRQ
jgi:ABC-2 type transport system permease protein